MDKKLWYKIFRENSLSEATNQEKANKWLGNALNKMTARDEKELAKEYPKGTKVEFNPWADMFTKNPFKKTLIGKITGYRGRHFVTIKSLDGKNFKGTTTNEFKSVSASNIRKK